MTSLFEVTKPLPGARFGGIARLASSPRQNDARAVIAAAEAEPEALSGALADCGGLLLLKGADAIAEEPALLVRLSRCFGPEVEDYRRLLTRVNMAHATVPEILLVTNTVPGARPPPDPPVPPLTPDGKFPVQYPQREGWHTDQSYRRPPPDISLFYAVMPVDRKRGQTLFASGALAYDALPSHLKSKIETLQGLHAQPGTGRDRASAVAGKTPRAFASHERSQAQPVVRTHPVTGKKAIYVYGLYLEPYQRFLKKTVKGLNGKDALETEDLIKHSLEVVDLENDLKAFVRKLLNASRAGSLSSPE